ncbi:MAG: hypothetical protein ACRD3A_04125, partial [Terriglobales bacterium]
AKHYVSGTGRSASWRPAVNSMCLIRPQFWYPVRLLPSNARSRVFQARIGFCDITGQTNERTLLAARIPPGVVCGNKVPTATFPEAGREQETVANCWLAIANSFLFDWLLRRVVTTTVNYFLLLALPFPHLEPSGREARTLGGIAAQLSGCVHSTSNNGNGSPLGWQKAELRAEIEWRVLKIFGQRPSTMELVLSDFPLLDRGQPPLAGEDRSTVTRDLVQLRAAENLGSRSSKVTEEWRRRVREARVLGALPFVPSHLGRMSSGCQ